MNCVILMTIRLVMLYFPQLANELRDFDDIGVCPAQVDARQMYCHLHQPTSLAIYLPASKQH